MQKSRLGAMIGVNTGEDRLTERRGSVREGPRRRCIKAEGWNVNEIYPRGDRREKSVPSIGNSMHKEMEERKHFEIARRQVGLVR